MNAPDTLTVLRAKARRLAKRIHGGGIDGYDRAKHLDAYTMEVADLAGLGSLIERLLSRPECCVIRGQLIDGDRATGVRRLLHMDKETGELPVFHDVPRRWLALDVEGLELPPGLPATDLPGCAALALALFPPAFHGAACIVQASASHGLKPDMRLRIWVWLDRPTWGHELKRWLRHAPADGSVFGAVQPIYTAAPVLVDGVADPMPQRLLKLGGRPVVEVPPPEDLAPPPPPTPVASATPTLPSRAHRYVRKALESAAERIANSMHPGRHPTIVAETTRLARFIEPGLLTGSDIAAVVRAAAQQAGKDDAKEIDSCIAWGLANPWTAGPLPGRGDRG